MSICSICKKHPSNSGRYCIGCRASRRLLEQVVQLPAELRGWGIDRVRILSGEIAEEVDRFLAKGEPVTAAPVESPIAGREEGGPELEVKKELPNEEEPVALAEEVKKQQGATEERHKKERKERKGSKSRKERSLRRRDRVRSPDRVESSRKVKKSKEESVEEEPKEREEEHPPKTREVREETTPRARESEELKEKKTRRRRSAEEEEEDETRTAPSSSVRLASNSPTRRREKPPEPEHPPRWARYPSPPPGTWAPSQVHRGRDRTPPRWKNKGRTKVVKQYYRRQQGW
eukprot:Skav211486  [mRNA]  locus=scaffold2188:232335:233201:- [translate_table: standard]